uniref:ACT domain-containing protein ACR n=1 Tax=Rhizophora mucronata TaxID=61149 RepID=A0A2P2KTY5_RHIMU
MFFQVDSFNKHGILLEVVQVLTDMNLTITKAYITSDCGWFMDGKISSSTINMVVMIESCSNILFLDVSQSFMWSTKRGAKSETRKLQIILKE